MSGQVQKKQDVNQFMAMMAKALVKKTKWATDDILVLMLNVNNRMQDSSPSTTAVSSSDGPSQ